MSAVAQPDFTGGAPRPFPVCHLDGLSLNAAAFSAPGARPYNEDRVGHAHGAASAFWTLADGLGGHRGGARAAQIAVEAGIAAALGGSGDLEQVLRQAVGDADAAVRAGQQRETEYPEMRSTLVLLGIRGRQFAWAHVGDSRLYHFREAKLRWRTRDHSAAQVLAAAGELDGDAIADHPDRSRLVSCLGGANPLVVSVRRADEAAGSGDVLLLCSDGMWEHFKDRELEGIVATAQDPEALLAVLAAQVAAKGREDQDNYTAIALFIR